MKLEIQALRALAVFAVIVYHMSPSLLPGGFVGVDVFFVISGYLIIGHLIAEIESTSRRFNPLAFWARRVRRLIPASTLVLVASIAGMYLWAPDTLWPGWLLEISASFLYVQNYLLAANSVDYLAAQNSASVVEHFWSLSAEEQFYIVWPLIILCIIYISRRTSRFTPVKLTFLALLVVTITSLGYSIYMVENGSSAAYFVSTSRAWEFSAGGLLSYYVRNGVTIAEPLKVAVSWIGLAGICGTFFLYDGNTEFPGVNAILPVVSTILVIVAGCPAHRWGTISIYRLRPVQWLADISYSAYLWHMPLLVLAPYILLGRVESSSSQKVIAVILALLLAAFTRKFVEKPFIIGGISKNLSPSRTFTLLLIPSVIGASLCIVGLRVAEGQVASSQAALSRAVDGNDACIGARALVNSDVCTNPLSGTNLTDPAVASRDIGIGVQEDDSCKQSIDGNAVLTCDFGSRLPSAPVIALVGDSHAGMWLAGLNTYGQRHGVTFRTYLKTYCPGSGFGGINSVDFATSVSAESCASWGSEVLTDLTSLPKLSGVIFANYTKSYGLSDANLGIRAMNQQAFDVAFSRLRAANIPVVALRDVGSMSMDTPSCVAQHPAALQMCSEPASVVLLPMEDDPFMQSAIANEVPIVDLSDLLCTSDGLCHAVVGGLVARFDSHHVSSLFARSASEILGSRVLSALRISPPAV